jgi:hypothetical protein
MNLETVFFFHRAVWSPDDERWRHLHVPEDQCGAQDDPADGELTSNIGNLQLSAATNDQIVSPKRKKSKKREITNDLQVLIDLFHVCSITYTIVRKNSGCS